MDNDRKKNLELFAKQLSEGLPFGEDFITSTSDIENNALKARDLSEDALANEVLKNTGVPIPSNNSPNLKKEDFLNRIVNERYPEFKDPNVRLGDEDSYWKKQITVNKSHPDLTASVSKSLHEAGHRFDDEVLKHKGTNLDLADLRKAKASGLDLKSMDPAQVYELYAKNHHAKIPDLREGSYGLGALKSMMKSGTFKQIAGALPLAGTAMALSSGDVSAAAEELPSEIPGIGQVYDAVRSESAGSAQDDKELINEVEARKSYDNSPAHQARLSALKNFSGK